MPQTMLQKAQAECVHHYVVDQDNHGRCKTCGAEKDFPRVPEFVFNVGFGTPTRPVRTQPAGFVRKASVAAQEESYD